MGFFSRLFGRKKKDTQTENNSGDIFSSPDLFFYVYFEDMTFGPFTLDEIKEYPLLEDTLITTNTLGGEWYEAKYFECFNDMFNPNLGFRITEDGTIIRE